jgi:NitT/TauT family transport system ATP-binding protein
VFQQGALFPWMDVAGNAGYGLRAAGVPGPDRRRRVAGLLELVGLGGLERTRPHQLSGGMQQRLALVRSIAPGPDLLLLDEPFSALDARTRFDLEDVLLSMWERTGTTLLLVTHSIEEAVYLSDRIVLLSPRPGRVSQIIEPKIDRSASPDEIRRDRYYLDTVEAIWQGLRQYVI